MAKINISLILKEEGGYANNPNDKGGETYTGISRKFFPHWAGWEIVDRYKRVATHLGKLNKKELNTLLSGQTEVIREIEKFYIVEFWNRIGGNRIHSQQVADNIMDFAVNAGVKRAVKYVQAILGTVQDGVMGDKTLTALNATGSKSFIELYTDKRIRFYKTIVKTNPSQNVFLAGWLGRVERIKNA